MNKQKIGCVGQGFVGTAIREKFKKHFNIYTYDKYNHENCLMYADGKVNQPFRLSLSTVVNNCDIIFVCVPTPMFEDGECDTSIVESVINDISKECQVQDKRVIVILKSTVPPGTTNKLNSISNKVSVVFSPEFLTEANAVEDFDKQNRIVLGIDYIELIKPINSIFAIVFPNADIININSIEAEMTKYMTNLFLATKVSFFNDMYSICDKLNINYDNVIEATMHDPRIGKSHYHVPGPDGDRGFGGTCFPKDLSAMLFIADSIKQPVPTLLGAHTTNQLVRKDKDWEKMEGRAVSKRIKESDEPSIVETDNVVIVDSPTFYVNTDDLLNVAYADNVEGEGWMKIECKTFNNPLNAPLKNEILYAFSENRGFYLEVYSQTENNKEVVNHEFED